MGTVLPLMVPATVLVGAAAVAVAVSKASGFSTLSLRLSAVLLAYLALIGVFAWLLERSRARFALLFLLVVLVGVGVTASVALYSGNLTPADLGLTRAAADATRSGDVGAQTRVYIWRDTVPMILDRPLMGRGPDNYREPFQPYISDELKALISDSKGNVRILTRAHSHLLQIAATTGLLGLAAYLWVLVSYFRNAYRRGGWTLAALSGGVLAYVLQIQTAFPSVATEVAFWGVLGASVALMRLRDRGAQDSEEGPRWDADPSRPPGKVRGELLVATVVIGLLAAIAVPTFLEQREKAANFERTQLAFDVRRTASFYERVERASGTYPEFGVFTRERPVKNLEGRPRIKPSRNVTITTKTNPEGGFTVEARSTILAGTFGYSYDSAKDEVTSYPDPRG